MSRRHASLLTTCLLVFPLLGMSAPVLAAEPVHLSAAPVALNQDYCRITGSSATVRAKPRKSAKPLGTAYRGDTCTAHGWAEGEGTWVKVTMKRTGVAGYVHSSLVAWGKGSLTSTG
ncbi:SH3 domain-containing protein [Streptomyces sp. ISL-22]|uniref:SH3 domain-containing protein n=1 Tax=unclassified Streptomyces TaxID=2593676 RepID=UPI001BEBFB10|nr:MULTISPECIES: SH3 domain-containing protein [unclassified Streptomyces]MBT2418073.1 SH3 domain-containing protein [Streptomyces sp. ISL-24]MBT2432252.1 SH3 domain-containing protein [Streptomyces sp. ISL-22]